MNLQQLEYIVAVDNHRHFMQAADHCCVTQPTLSMMIKKLEEELDVKIFDRTKQPIIPTEIGKKIIDQARTAIRESAKIQEIAKQFNGVLAGELRIGVIPTISPYLLPAIIQPFIEKYPDIHLQINEMITEQIHLNLKNGNLDAGIVATKSGEFNFRELPLYNEPFYAFVSADNSLYNKQYIFPEDIRSNELWLLEEGHCLSSQIQRLCEVRQNQLANSFLFRSGSIETLIKMVEKNGGITILPEFAARELSGKRKSFLRKFIDPVPSRDVYLVVNREQVKLRLIEVFRKEILTQVPLINQEEFSFSMHTMEE